MLKEVKYGKFEWEIIKPLNEFIDAFITSLRSICQYKHCVEIRLSNTLKEHPEDINEKFVEILFNIETLWNSFGNLLIPLRRPPTNAGNIYPIIYKNIINSLDDDKYTKLDKIIKDFKVFLMYPNIRETCSDFMYATSKLFNYLNDSIVISKNLEGADLCGYDINETWKTFYSFCTLNIKEYIVNNDMIDKSNTKMVFIDDIIKCLFDINDIENIPDCPMMMFMNAVINAYLFKSYDYLSNIYKESYMKFKKDSKDIEYMCIEEK